MGHLELQAKYYVEELRMPPISIHREIGEWLHYNFAAGSFHSKNFVADFIRLNLHFIHKNDKFAFWATLWGVRGNVGLCTSFIARWIPRGRLPIRDNWTFFASSYGGDVISRYWSKSALFKRGWATLTADFRWKGTSPRIIVGVRKLACFCYLTGKTAWSYLHSSGYTVQERNRRTDRLTELPSRVKQVAQLWQRDRAKLDTFSINVQRYSQNFAQNCNFGPPYVRIKGNIYSLSEIFNTKKTL